MRKFWTKDFDVITFFRTFFLLFFTLCILIYPNISLDAAKKGFILWSTVVFPALLPFFVLSDLLIKYGIVRFLGIFLDPIIGALFKVSGVGGIIFTLSIVSGFPNGARMATQLYHEGVLSKDETERIIAFSNFSNPIFILGAVAIGMFGNIQMGIALLIIHIVSNVFVGIIFGIGKKRPQSSQSFIQMFQTEWKQLQTTSKQIESFGFRLSESVKNAVQTLLLIGGLIMIFAVINALLKASQVTPLLATGITELLPFFHTDYIQVTFTALLEVTIGLKHLSEISPPVLFNQMLLAAMLLGFNGFSVHAQVIGVLATENLRYRPFFIGRVLQSVISGLLVFVLFRPVLYPFLSKESQTVFAPIQAEIHSEQSFLFSTEITLYLFTFTMCVLIYALFLWYKKRA